MAESTWTTQEDSATDVKPRSNVLKFVVGGVLMAAAIVFLIWNGMRGNMQFYVTVDEYYAKEGSLDGRELRVSGWVLGDSIQFTQIDATHSRMEFEIVDNIRNPGQRLRVVAFNEAKPDLLQHEAQALVQGRIGDDGHLYANKGGVMLKCPTRYEEGETGAYPDGYPEQKEG
jgi:cytochrome c-type biogenesis protein CcmE